MRVRLLGPVDVLTDAGPRPIVGRRRRAVLAILALNDGEIVSTDWLVNAIYGEGASPGATSTLQSHVSVLRMRWPAWLPATRGPAMTVTPRAVFASALAAFEKVDGHASLGRIHSQLGRLAERRQQPAEMLGHCRQALELYQVAGYRPAEAVTLNDVGYSLGYIHHQLGNYREAISCYRRSVVLCRHIADRYNEAATLDHLGDVEFSAGDQPAAARTWASALDIFTEIDHPDGDQLRLKLLERELGVPA